MAEQLLTDDALRDRLVAEAGEHVLRFDWADVARQTVAVYDAAACAGARRRRRAPTAAPARRPSAPAEHARACRSARRRRSRTRRAQQRLRRDRRARRRRTSASASSIAAQSPITAPSPISTPVCATITARSQSRAPAPTFTVPRRRMRAPPSTRAGHPCAAPLDRRLAPQRSPDRAWGRPLVEVHGNSTWPPCPRWKATWTPSCTTAMVPSC